MNLLDLASRGYYICIYLSLLLSSDLLVVFANYSMDYTREDILSFRSAAPRISRHVRKVLFDLHLWRPRHSRSVCAADVHISLDRGRRGDTTADSTPAATLRLDGNNNNNNGARLFSVANFNARSIRNKSASICDIIREHKLHVLAITESWQDGDDDLSIKRITPDGYRCMGQPRSAGTGQRGGGLLIVYRDNLTAKRVPIGTAPTTFEVLGANSTVGRSNVIFLVIYRPGSKSVCELFFTELIEVLESLAVYNCQVIITGDINIHLDVKTDPHTIRFEDLLDSFGLVQHVVGATHDQGHTLDVVITRSDLSPPSITIGSPFLSDHSVVFFQLSLQIPPLEYVDIQTRAWKGFNADEFRRDLLSSDLCQLPTYYDGISVDRLHDMYDDTLRDLLEKHAPRRNQRRRYQPLTPWFDSDCSAAKRRSRVYERRYRKTGSSADRSIWIAETRNMHELYKRKQNEYWKRKVHESSGDPKKLWKTLDSVLGRGRPRPPGGSGGISAEGFSKAFANKVDRIRERTESAPYPDFSENHCDSIFDSFSEITADDVRRLIGQAKNKTCNLDPVPTWIVKEFADQLSPFVSLLFNPYTPKGGCSNPL